MNAHLQHAWQRILQVPWRSLTWLTMGLSLLLICLVMWLWLQLATRRTLEVVEPEATMATPAAQKQGFDSAFGSLTDVVPVLDLTQKVAKTGAHAAEFRGGAFLTRQAKNWTLQLMNVTQESVIIDYLSGRRDRERFQYFRTVKQEQERYVLTYGDFATVQTAMGALATIDFGLPSSVKPFPERFSSYQPYVTDQGSDERVVGAGASRAHQVKLRTVAIPVAPVPSTVPPRDVTSDSQEPAIGHLATDPVVTSPAEPIKRTPQPARPVEDLSSAPAHSDAGALTDDQAVQDPFD